MIDNLEYTQCRVDDMIGSDMPTLISSWMSILVIVLLQATIVLKEFQSELVAKWKSKAEAAKDEMKAKVKANMKAKVDANAKAGGAKGWMVKLVKFGQAAKWKSKAEAAKDE